MRSGRIEAALTRAWRHMRQRHIGVPFLVPPAAWIAGHDVHGRSVAVVALGGALAAVASVAVVRWRLERRQCPPMALDSALRFTKASAAVAALWLDIAALYGPGAGPGHLAEWMMLGAALAWGGWWHHRNRPSGGEGEPAAPAPVRERETQGRDGAAARAAEEDMARRKAAKIEWWNTEIWGKHAANWRLAGSKITDWHEHEGMESIAVQLVPGEQSWTRVQQIIPLLESALQGKVPYNRTTCVVDGADPSIAWLHLKCADPLNRIIPWDASLAPADITQPAPLALLDDGELLRDVLLASHFMIGRTGSGKTNELSVLYAAITGCHNSRLWLGDLKGGRSAIPWLPACDWVAVTLGEIRLMERTAYAEVYARLASQYHGEGALRPTPAVPALFVGMDEVRKVLSSVAGDLECRTVAAGIAGEGREAMVRLLLATQYGSLEESVGSPQIRMNLERRYCFAVEDPADGQFALGVSVFRGADPSQLAEPGQFLYRGHGRVENRIARGFCFPHEVVREVAGRNAERTGLHRNPLQLACANMIDEQTGMTYGEIYATRWDRLPQQFRRYAHPDVWLHSGVAAGVAPPVATPAQPQPRPVHPEVQRQLDEINETGVAVASGEVVDLVAETERRKSLWAARFEAAGREGVAPIDLQAASGLKKTWTQGKLTRLVSMGAARHNGERTQAARYWPVTGIWEALLEIEAEDRRQAETGRELART